MISRSKKGKIRTDKNKNKDKNKINNQNERKKDETGRKGGFGRHDREEGGQLCDGQIFDEMLSKLTKTVRR
jgi:hypothetical protein